MTNRPIAAIDIGTNTALLLVARRGAAGGLEVLHDEQRFVRLGEGVDAARRITDAAIQRLLAVLRDYRRTADALGVPSPEAVHLVATSASRDAANIADVQRAVRDATGLDYRVISGADEARLSFLGARSAFSTLAPDTAVLDIGGGSTELVVGNARALAFRHSYDVGAVRYAERFLPTQPPAPTDVQRLRTALHAGFAEPAATLDPTRVRFVGAAGTAAALALLDAGANTWPELERTSGESTRTLPVATVGEWADRLARLSEADVLALGPGIMAGRADVFPTGVLILEAVMARYGFVACDVTVRGLRHGVALGALE